MNDNDLESGSFKIRPAGRHLQTIGRDLIQNMYAAIIELVKNAYDADSPDVNITFTKDCDRNTYTVCIEDHGHGMTRDVVTGKWLVPSTDDKFNRKTSPEGRVMQGRKGVGRFASAILGEDLLLETVTKHGEKTTAYIQWDEFSAAKYLDDVDILIETQTVSEPQGTRLTISGTHIFAEEWNDSQFKNLIFELRKMKSPIPQSEISKYFKTLATDDDKSKKQLDQFDIKLSIKGFHENIDKCEEIAPFPLFDLFDYRIAGFIDETGKASLTYSLRKIRNAEAEVIEYTLPERTMCGSLYFDIRVYDRDKEAIDTGIQLPMTAAVFGQTPNVPKATPKRFANRSVKESRV